MVENSWWLLSVSLSSLTNENAYASAIVVFPVRELSLCSISDDGISFHRFTTSTWTMGFLCKCSPQGSLLATNHYCIQTKQISMKFHILSSLVLPLYSVKLVINFVEAQVLLSWLYDQQYTVFVNLLDSVLLSSQ